MPGLRPVVLVPIVSVLLVAGALPPAQGAQRALPETVVVHDGRTSPPAVDISMVSLEASWYWDSEQYVRVTVPHGFRPGQRMTVWFDLDGDSTPDGHFYLRLGEPRKPGGKSLRRFQEFRVGGGWSHGGELVRCTGSEGFRPVGEIRRGERTAVLGLDLWWCLKTPTPEGADSGSWRVAVSVAKGRKEDLAPNHRGWSKPVAGWGPCDPSGGPC